MMTRPAKIDLAIYQGATFRKRLTWTGPKPARTPIDLTGCTARMQVRVDFDAPLALLSLTTENSGLTLGGTLGTIDMYLADADTTALTLDASVYDLEIAHPNGDVTRIAQGRVTVFPEVTRG